MTRENAIKGLLEVAAWNYGKYEQTHEEDYLNDGDFLMAVANLLKAQEPVDAVPVVHGRWKVILNPFWDAECSECGFAKRNGWEWGFCPNCGAKMDGERRDES